jgi:aminopeptidase
VALVDGHSAVGNTGLVFYDTLFDENASSHIAFGASIVQALPWAPELSAEERHERGVNHSSIHTDFMIGSNELEIEGVSKTGETVAILRHGDWLL